MKTKHIVLLCVLYLPACGYQDERQQYDTGSTALTSVNAPQDDADGRIFYATKSAFSQTDIWRGVAFRFGDVIKRATGLEDIFVKSGNLEVESSKEYKLATCALRKMGLTLPKTKNGVYWAHWTEDASLFAGVTYTWSKLGTSLVSYTLINDHYRGVHRSSCSQGSGRFSSFLVTMYHEIKGHNVDGSNHESDTSYEDFVKRYEDPVFTGLLKNRTCYVFDACIATLSQ